MSYHTHTIVNFILKGGDSGRTLYFNCPGWMKDFKGPYVIVDGKQRLEAARKFVRNELSVFDGVYLKDQEELDKVRGMLENE